ncbi:UNVERIFIED_ORG: flagellar motor switch protein FliM [Zoogloea ramigera]|uniref:FliM/FliN family flagellar motor C-terminal domain-containing protein n=1 Tax=Duganella zoogloeoides TaxID=75659 RepID=A0ABZ0XRS8_9BURK|nr:FliM/FliN family flagellar motor C-terminal domain-containing protein [Duganella zoogloeoides]WQH02379.1 FliM/FliN family flagellar motor C-terminal domain-containing protein [Duganella zoogloeoides]
MTKQTAQHQVLDPSLLGRPVHLLPIFAAQLRDDLTQSMRLNMHRRYWGGFQVEDVQFSRIDSATAPSSRWLSFAAPAGQIAFSLERKVLLSVLNYRYSSGAKSDSVAEVDEAAVRVTATEERLAVVLGQQLAGILAGRIEANLPETNLAPGARLPSGAAAAAEEPVEDYGFKPTTGAHPAKGAWVIVVTLAGATSGVTAGRFWFALDKQLMAGVLRGLLRDRDGAKKRKPAGPLAQRLHLGITGRLASKEVMLGSLYDLQVGDIIPISLHRADVLLEDSRLFTAAVTEHKGKLCLTSFEDAE